MTHSFPTRRSADLQDAVPGKARSLCHVGQQADVPVRQRGDQEPRAEQVQSLDGIRPWIQPMPCHVKVQQFVVRESTLIDAGVSQAVPKIFDMQDVEAAKRPLSAADAFPLPNRPSRLSGKSLSLLFSPGGHRYIKKKKPT